MKFTWPQNAPFLQPPCAPAIALYALSLRFLLVNNHCITDPTAGVTQSLRTIVEWLADAGHECRVLTTARFESRVTFTIDDHLASLGVDRSQVTPAPASAKRRDRDRRSASRPVVQYAAS